LQISYILFYYWKAELAVHESLSSSTVWNSIFSYILWHIYSSCELWHHSFWDI